MAFGERKRRTARIVASASPHLPPGSVVRQFVQVQSGRHAGANATPITGPIIGDFVSTSSLLGIGVKPLAVLATDSELFVLPLVGARLLDVEPPLYRAALPGASVTLEDDKLTVDGATLFVMMGMGRRAKWLAEYAAAPR